MLFVVESKKSFREVCAAMEPTVQKHKFGVMSTHDLKETMAKKGIDFDRECVIFEVCNPHQAKKVLSSKMDVSTALPCRISVYQEGEKVKLVTMKPTMMLELFNAPELKPVAEEVEKEIFSIMREAAE